jgi:hypothetical protein
VRRQLTQRLSAALHGTLDSYLRDAFKSPNKGIEYCSLEGISADAAVACLHDFMFLGLRLFFPLFFVLLCGFSSEEVFSS